MGEWGWGDRDGMRGGGNAREGTYNKETFYLCRDGELNAHGRNKRIERLSKQQVIVIFLYYLGY